MVSVGVTLLAYIYFRFRVPNRLHSERYQLGRHKPADGHSGGEAPAVAVKGLKSKPMLAGAAPGPLPGPGELLPDLCGGTAAVGAGADPGRQRLRARLI